MIETTSASSRAWLVINDVVFFKLEIIFQMSWHAWTSTPAVGSSIKTTSGFPINDKQIHNFLFCLPERSPARFFSICDNCMLAERKSIDDFNISSEIPRNAPKSSKCSWRDNIGKSNETNCWKKEKWKEKEAN